MRQGMTDWGLVGKWFEANDDVQEFSVPPRLCERSFNGANMDSSVLLRQ
jgi:hypothetical protein